MAAGDRQPEPPIPPISTTDLVDKLEKSLQREIDAGDIRLAERIQAFDRLVTDKFAVVEEHRKEQKADIDKQIATLNSGLNSLTIRMTTVEATTAGQTQARANLYATLGAVVAVLVIVGIVAAFGASG